MRASLEHSRRSRRGFKYMQQVRYFKPAHGAMPLVTCPLLHAICQQRVHVHAGRRMSQAMCFTMPCDICFVSTVQIRMPRGLRASTRASTLRMRAERLAAWRRCRAPPGWVGTMEPRSCPTHLAIAARFLPRMARKSRVRMRRRRSLSPVHVARGTWQEARGKRHVARGTWQEARGKRHVARGTWHVARGTWHVMANGKWQAACDKFGSRREVRGMWHVARVASCVLRGVWHVVHGVWRVASGVCMLWCGGAVGAQLVA